MCPSTNVSGGDGGASGCPDLGCTNGAPCANAGCTDFTVNGVCDFATVLTLAKPNPAAGSGQGLNGGEAGELTYNAPTNRTVCNFCDDNPTLGRIGGRGGDGVPGTNGQAGEGCSLLYLGDGLGRYRGGIGTSGGAGTDGSGGGGGTAGGGYAVIGGTVGCESRPGGSGGGGGSGGCGSPGTDPGQGGGVSAAVVIKLDQLPANMLGPAFTNVEVVTASGGDGGDGGVGATGGSAGVGALGGGAAFWCSRTGGRGGDGGGGGSAGGGGGGCGGGSHAFMIVAMAAPTYTEQLMNAVTISKVGAAGRAGRGGYSPVAPGADGAAGDDTAIVVITP